jgi:hypothetical protein
MQAPAVFDEVVDGTDVAADINFLGIVAARVIVVITLELMAEGALQLSLLGVAVRDDGVAVFHETSLGSPSKSRCTVVYSIKPKLLY